MDTDTMLFIGILLFVLMMGFWFRYNINKEKKELINSEFKIAHISDNMGQSYYKIVCRKGKEDNFIEVDKIFIVQKEFISKYAVPYAYRDYDNKDDAEKGLKKFLIHIGKVPYEKEIKLDNSQSQFNGRNINKKTYQKRQKQLKNQEMKLDIKWDNICFGYTYENCFGLKPNLHMNNTLLNENGIASMFRPIFPNLKIFQKPEISEEALPKYYIIFNCYSMFKKSDEDFTYMELLVLSDNLNFEQVFRDIQNSITVEFWKLNSEPAYF